MLSLERQSEILEILSKVKSATVDELSQALFVSGATIRRDLKIMDGQGLIRRSHGGAMAISSKTDESATFIREQENINAKLKSSFKNLLKESLYAFLSVISFES